jgi:hypothetical protein
MLVKYYCQAKIPDCTRMQRIIDPLRNDVVEKCVTGYSHAQNLKKSNCYL